MTLCLFASDLHGREGRYEALLAEARARRPAALFLGGDLLPHGPQAEFVEEYLLSWLRRLNQGPGPGAPRVFAILGNDDRRSTERALRAAEPLGLLEYAHERRSSLAGRPVLGYACVPPTPFRLKDWERFDVSRFVDPGCLGPEEGVRSVPVPDAEARHGTILEDLARLAGDADLTEAVLLFHSPPYRTALDRAALDGRSVDHAPLDVHVGSIAIRRFVEQRQPWLTLHGHVHESARLSGAWRDTIGRTHCLSAAHDGPELALVSFDLEDPARARRELIPPARAPRPGPMAAGGRLEEQP